SDRSLRAVALIRSVEDIERRRTRSASMSFPGDAPPATVPRRRAWQAPGGSKLADAGLERDDFAHLGALELDSLDGKPGESPLDLSNGVRPATPGDARPHFTDDEIVG